MQRLSHMAARALAAALIASLALVPAPAWAGGAPYGDGGNRAVHGGSAGRSPALGSESGPEPEPEKRDLSGATVTVGGGSLVYDGQEKRPPVTVSLGGVTLEEGTDYTKDYGNNVGAGIGVVAISGIGSYEGSTGASFTIAKAAQTITASDKSVLAGSTVPLGATTSGDGALSYRSSDTTVATVSGAGEVTGVAGGTATITIHASETINYSSAEAAVEVTVTGASSPGPEPEKKDLSGATVTVGGGRLVYDSKAKTPLVTVTLGGVTLEKGTDYTVAYSDNVNAGTATVDITGAGGYEGTASTTFTIAKAMSSIKIAAQTKTYTGEAIAYSGKVTKSGSRGKVTYAYYSDANCTKKVSATNVKNPGLYYVKATLAESKNYDKATSAVAKLTIRPKGTSIAKVTAASAGFTVAWRKQATQTSGYQIQFSLSSEFEKGKTVTVTIPKPAVTRREVSKLGKKKAYYVRVRTFKKVGGKTYYSAWSEKKKVRTRK